MAMRMAALSLFLYSFCDDCQLKILKSSLSSDKMLFANYQLYCIIHSISPLGLSQSVICYNNESNCKKGGGEWKVLLFDEPTHSRSPAFWCNLAAVYRPTFYGRTTDGIFINPGRRHVVKH